MKTLDLDNNGGLKFSQQIADYMQQAYSEIFAAFAASFGDKVILTGCVDNGSVVTNGWILYNGEPIRFVGGVSNTKVAITNTGVNSDFKNGIPKKVKYDKTATCASIGVFNFSELVSIRTIASLNTLVSSLEDTLTDLDAAFIAHHHDWEDIQDKPAGYITYVGTESIGDIDPTDKDLTITIPDQGGTNYQVSGGLRMNSPSSDPHTNNDVSWVAYDLHATYFKVSFGNTDNNLNDLSFDYQIIKTL